MLKNALEGYNCTMFAYGQTGAGKSYSFVGYGSNKGILPIVSTEIFAKVRAEQSDNHVFQIACSYMEIYGRAPRWHKSCSPPPERCPWYFSAASVASVASPLGLGLAAGRSAASCVACVTPLSAAVAS